MAPARDAAKLLRAELLRGTDALLAGAEAKAPRHRSALAAIGDTFTKLGARVWKCAVLGGGGAIDEQEVEGAVKQACADGAAITRLVVDGAALFMVAGAGRSGMRLCLEAAWSVTRAVANAAFIPCPDGGRITYLAPAPGAGAHAIATRAGLENLSRTLSIEWARHGITAVTIAPGDDSRRDELAALAAYLASPAGAYFSGCLLDLRGPAAAGWR